MPNKVTLREILVWIAFLTCFYHAFVKKYDFTELEKGKARAEERIKIYQEQIDGYEKQKDSLKHKQDSLRKALEEHKKNPLIIEKKYYEIRKGVLTLPVDGKISYLSARVSAKGRHQ